MRACIPLSGKWWLLCCKALVLQKIKRGKVPGAWLPDLRAYSAHRKAGLRQPCSKCLEPRVPGTRAPHLTLRNCRGPAAGWWGDVVSRELARIPVRTPGLPRLQPNVLVAVTSQRHTPSGWHPLFGLQEVPEKYVLAPGRSSQTLTRVLGLEQENPRCGMYTSHRWGLSPL